MANEILKDEVLTEEQLENVAGGTRGELSCDTKLLEAVGVMDFSYNAGYCENHMAEVQSEVNGYLNENDKLKGFSIATVDVKGANTYKIGDKTVSRAKFYDSICKALGKDDFKWKKFL